MTGYKSKRAAAQDKLDSMEREARELASQFGSRMCDENGDTHGEELYCFSLDDIIAIKEVLAQPPQRPWVLQREWVDLTDEEIDKWTPEIHGVIHEVIAQFKEKNNG
jgi:hypothetical protein